LIPTYESKSIKSAMKFAEKCGRAFQNKNIPPVYLDEVISTRLEDTEAERLWYEDWRATDPSEREDFDKGFKRRFLPIVDYNTVVKKCHDFIPDSKSDVIDVGNDLRKVIRPYIRLLQNPMEQMQAEKAMMAAYRNLVGTTWSLHISMARCTDIDEAIQLLYNYKLENPGEEMVCEGIKRGRVNYVQLEEEYQSLNMMMARKTNYFCDYCKKDGHTRTRCIKLALSLGKATPDGYRCRNCGEMEKHLFSVCPLRKKEGESNTQEEQKPSREEQKRKEFPFTNPGSITCFRCKGIGHGIRECPSPIKNEAKQPGN
jgi:hypothetical protein